MTNDVCRTCKYFTASSGGWSCARNDLVSLTVKGYRDEAAGVPDPGEWGCPEWEPP